MARSTSASLVLATAHSILNAGVNLLAQENISFVWYWLTSDESLPGPFSTFLSHNIKVIEKLRRSLPTRVMICRRHVLDLYPPPAVYHLDVCHYLSLWLAEGHHGVHYVFHIAKVSLFPEQFMLLLHVRGPRRGMEREKGGREGGWASEREERGRRGIPHSHIWCAHQYYNYHGLGGSSQRGTNSLLSFVQPFSYPQHRSTWSGRFLHSKKKNLQNGVNHVNMQTICRGRRCK